jgi:hypothetical protein
LHASHAPSHAPLQHTPSTQKPESQSDAWAQDSPLPLGPLQVPPSQLLPDLHSAPEAHVASQLLAPVQKLPPHSLPGSVAGASGAHVPTLPATLHAMQVPLQATSQQTPSTQYPVAHWLPLLQAVPTPPVDATHRPATHAAPSHWASLVQGRAQLPWPLQVAVPQPFSTSVPAGRGAQPPTSPGRLQASHAPVHAPLQHTPSTQKPEAQSDAWAHASPLPFGPLQVPPSQLLGALHWPLLEQVARHRPAPSQKLPPHSLAGSVPAVAGAHEPALPGTLQDSQGPAQGLLQQTPSVHAPDSHSAARKQAAPSGRSATHAPKEQMLPSLQSESRRHGEVQADWPLQTPAPHSDWGSIPGAYGVQPPTSPGTLHASHVPPQARLQHTPSTQYPEAHSEPWAQASPLPLGPAQVPPEQAVPDLHSAPEAHVASQLPRPVQTLPPHSLTGSVPEANGVHVPSAPETLQASHGPVQETPQQTPSVQYPEAHWPARTHAVPEASSGWHVPSAAQKVSPLQAQSSRQGLTQAPAPSQVNAPQRDSGSVPAAYGVQPPSKPGTLHASQAPLQAPLQHTPSTQRPDAQSEPWPHARPLPLGPLQVPPVQVLPDLHSALEVQVASQLPAPEQVPPPHSDSTSDPAASAVHVPSSPGTSHAMQVPLQPESQQTPSTQFQLSHAADAVHAVPLGCFCTQAPAAQR